MNNQATIEKMQLLRLPGIQAAYQALLQTVAGTDYTNDQFIGHLIEAEWLDRQNRKHKRLLKSAHFRYQAGIESIEYSHKRNLDKTLLHRLSDCSFINRGENIIITGATGTGKSYLASALGQEACLKGYKVLYCNTGKLFSKLRMAGADQSYLKEIAKMEKMDLLILDDFGLQPIDNQNRLILLDIIEDRHNRKSMIITSQIPVGKWHDVINEQTIADAILDRIVHTAHRIEVKGESMRKIKPGGADGA
jgi:DNA replication protein DnaC